MLEEMLQVAHQMWGGDEAPYHGQHYQLARPLCSPGPVQVPHPPILIAGGGEHKTLRLVAQYANACHLPGYAITVGGADLGGDLRHKLDVLREHCAAAGRSYDDISKTVGIGFDPGASPREFLATLSGLADLGFDHVMLSTSGPWQEESLTALAGLLPGIHAIGPR
jgi:alkanesulfonate monooxygenase SsuD/methylene tetrahydromethanopterin reductase-like flavin-dependent oxidoreductase (luciferase family)